ncbi:MAG: DUF368 domain-containing protein [Chromatiales bacterium]|nr:DUF368 domain-containing protein [Chromatiales bacterium]
MGTADVVPGVSGGTMAFILGIYQRLLNAISSFNPTLLGLVFKWRLKDAFAHCDVWFLIALGAGVVAAVAVFTRVIPLPTLIQTHPELIYGLFFGLIVGSAAVLLKSLGAINAKDCVLGLVGIVIGFLVVNLVPVQTPDAAWFVALSGALAISAMLLPGISGSFILLVLQKYAYVFDALGRLDFSVIVPFATGCVVGLLGFSHLLSWLLARWYRGALMTIIGLLIGSLWRIWPFQERIFVEVRGKSRLLESIPMLPTSLDATTLGSAGLAVVGVVTVGGIHWLASKHKHD